MAERTSGWENCRPVRSTLTRPSCSAGARAHASGPAPRLAAALRSGPSATAASSSAVWAGSGSVLNRELMTAISRSLGGSGSAAQRRLAAGSAAITLASSISAIGITGRLGEHLHPGPPAGRPGLPVQQEAGVGRR